MDPHARYRCVDLTFFRAGQSLVTAAGPGGAARVLDGPRAQLLGGCTRFRTLPEHAAALAPSLKTPAGVLLEALRQLAEAGLLLSYEQARARALQSRLPLPPPIGRVTVATRSRPQVLLRGLRGLLQGCARAGRGPAICVFDDSPLHEAAQTRAALGALRAETALPISHADHEDKRAFARALAARAGVPEALARFALGSDLPGVNTNGANYNAALLAGAGGLSLSLDDDVVCRVASLRRGPQGLRLTARADFGELFPMADPAAARARLSPEPLDVLALHEEHLGRGLADCADRSGEGPPDLDEIDADLLRAPSRRARVALTCLGLYGDSGMGSPLVYLALRGAARAHLLQSEAHYRAALASRQVVHGVPRPTIYGGNQLMSYCVGYDCRVLLPPFFPVLRNTDGVFVATLRRCLPDRYLSMLPYAVEHAPAEPRAHALPGLWEHFAGRLELNLLLMMLIGQHRPLRAADASDAEQIAALGRTLRDFGAMAPGEFDDLARLLMLRHMEQCALALEALLGEHKGQPAYWARDVATFIAALRKARSQPRGHVPSDLRAQLPPGGEMAFAQDLVLRFGELLCAWPLLWAAAPLVVAEEQDRKKALR